VRTSTAFPNLRIYGSCSGIDFVVPSVDDGVAVEIVNELDDALFELVFRADANVAEHRAGGFGEEAQIKHLNATYRQLGIVLLVRMVADRNRTPLRRSGVVVLDR
jgi:hypothetical protein